MISFDFIKLEYVNVQVHKKKYLFGLKMKE